MDLSRACAMRSFASGKGKGSLPRLEFIGQDSSNLSEGVDNKEPESNAQRTINMIGVQEATGLPDATGTSGATRSTK